MKKIFFISFFSIQYAFAQVGIGTKNPNKALQISDISGATTATSVPGTSTIQIITPTVRIEGLNNANQSVTDKIRPVSVTDKGDVVLAPALVVPLIMIDDFNISNTEKDYLTAVVTTDQTSTNLTTNTVLRSFNFTLSSPSLVRLGAVTSFQFYQANSTSRIADDSNRQWGTKFRFSAAPAGIPTSATSYFGKSLKGYYSKTPNTTDQGIYYSNSEDVLYLPAGSYTIEIIAAAATASGQAPMRIINGAGNDTFSVVAYPVQ
ncbi:hypothetical protein [uncultured Chryseobacterium sp.]|uniref:hypothetical protein n=1 Tax=uncultured Chryseobacterium sp. TaxID=259322 RepID=UPI0025E32458|nr:hypothetical protein [uncultured Chryseobacterium sp.]